MNTVSESNGHGIPAGTWVVDPHNSSIEFEVKNFDIITVSGYFAEFEGTVTSTGQADGTRASGTVKTASLSTRVPDRDERVLTTEFLDVKLFPEINFTSSSIEPLGDGLFRIGGDMTMKDVSRHVELDATMRGPIADHRDVTRVAVDAVGEIDRMEFGLDWDERTPAGAPMASHGVKLIFHLGLRKVPAGQGA